MKLSQGRKPTSNNELPQCLLNLRSIYPSLPKVQQRLADIVLKNPLRFLQLDSIQIGRLGATSNATVVRFCQRIGYSGLSEMKQLLVTEMSGAAFVDSKFENDRKAGLLEQILAGCTSAIEDTLALVDLAAFGRVAKKIAECDSLYVFGSGQSMHLAHEAADKFMALGIKANAFARPDLQLIAAKLIQANDVVIAISHSGNYVPTVKALEEAKKNGAHCVAITSFSRSLITKTADIVLFTSPPLRSFKGQTVPRRIAQAIILDLIAILMLQPNKRLERKTVTDP